MLTTATLTAATVGLAVAAVAAAAVARRDGPVGWLHLLVAALVSGLGTVLAAMAILVLARVDVAFALAHLGYLALVLTVPLAALGLGALALRRGAPRLVRAAIVVSLLPAGLGYYATHVEPYRLRVDHHVVAVDPARAGDDEVTIGVLADLQTSGVGDHERRAVDDLMAAAPDVILLPGDLFQGDLTDADLAAMRDLLGRLDAPAGVFFVQGDADGDLDDPDRPGARILAGLAVTTLDDEVTDVTVGDRTLRIGGTALDYASAAADRVRAELQAEPPDDGAVTVLVSHRPDTVLALPADSRVDLTVAGHTHGGQIVLPVLGPIATLSDVPRDVARGGLHAIDGNPIYVSPGVGMERGRAPQARFLSRPAIGILTLTDA